MTLDTKEKDNKNNAEEKIENKTPKEELVETKHSISINGTKIDYTVKTGTLIIKHESDTKDEAKEPIPKASIFYIAYLRDGTKPESRPLTFSFNGGPGSSSVWLHLGLLGPKRVISEKEGIFPVENTNPPYKLVQNEYSLLDVTDLIFIDPVSTGFSRAVVGEKAGQFHEYNKDIESVAQFIRLAITRFNRWPSPKFLIGESYGTTRAAGLSGYLQKNYSIYLNGIMLISSILNFQTAKFGPGNDLPYLLFLPTYAASAFYHGVLDEKFKNLEQTLEEVKKFGEDEYLKALIQGDSLQGTERQHIVDKLSLYTGLSKEYIEQTNLRINIHRFCKELLRKTTGKTIGRMDSRFTGIDYDKAGENPDFDPSLASIQAAYTATFNDYVRRELKFESDLPYEILKGLYLDWKFDKHQNSFLNVAETLREAISMNNSLKVIVTNGYFDLATPYWATEYTFNHLGLHQELRNNISMTYYEAGHMMYSHLPSLKKQKEDLAKFIKSAI